MDDLWDACVAHGLWLHRLQRPGYVVPGHNLLSAPWWTDTHHLFGKPGPEARPEAGTEGEQPHATDLQQPVYSDSDGNASCSEQQQSLQQRSRRYAALR